jgi:hypothetical protein
MGYNLKVDARSPELRNKMVRFMEDNHKNPGDMAGPPEKRGKKGIVIEYSSCLDGQERVHVYSTVRWMALQVGMLRSKFNKESVDPNVFDQPVPYMSYDSCENWPILVCDSEKEAMAKWPKSLWWCCTDRLGVYLGEKTSESIVHAVSLALFIDKKKTAAFEKEMLKIGPMPRGDPEHEKWIAKKHAIQAKLLKPETRAMMKEIRSDIGRLDKLWQGFKT